MADDTASDREQRIRERAHLIWIEEGRPEGRAGEHWRLAAEALDAEEAAVTPLTDILGTPTPILPPVH